MEGSKGGAKGRKGKEVREGGVVSSHINMIPKLCLLIFMVALSCKYVFIHQNIHLYIQLDIHLYIYIYIFIFIYIFM